VAVSGSYDRSVRVWDAQTGIAIGESLAGHNGRVLSVAVSSDGTRIVSGSADATARIWNVEAGEQVGSALQGHTSWVRSVAFSPDGRHVVSGSDDMTIRIWNVETGEQLRTLQGHGNSVLFVATNGRHVVSGSADRTVRIWDFETGEQVGESLTGHTDVVSSVATSSSKGWIISGSNDATVRIWDMEKRSHIRKLDAKRSVCSVAVSDETNKIAAGTYSRAVLIWDMEAIDAEPVTLSARHGWFVLSVAFSRDGCFLVSGSADKTIKVWDVLVGEEVDYYEHMLDE
jgi:WD40 repeat protein